MQGALQPLDWDRLSVAGRHVQFDSGQLGDRTPAVGRMDWKTPKSLPLGTYTYFCRIHPSMRGAFRVKK